jgi:hypothetical protein
MSHLWHALYSSSILSVTSSLKNIWWQTRNMALFVCIILIDYEIWSFLCDDGSDCVGSDVLRTVPVNSTVFWDVTHCSLMKVHRPSPPRRYVTLDLRDQFSHQWKTRGNSSLAQGNLIICLLVFLPSGFRNLWLVCTFCLPFLQVLYAKDV